MIDNQRLGVTPARYWKDLLEAAVVETSFGDLLQRIQDAHNAVVDEIEICYPTANNTERQALINALNIIREFRRLCETPWSGSSLQWQVSRPESAQA